MHGGLIEFFENPSDKIGKEVISRVTTTILQSDGTFYTDSNGFYHFLNFVSKNNLNFLFFLN
jgi:hypothetical protein